jgi:hypothetical protein
MTVPARQRVSSGRKETTVAISKQEALDDRSPGRKGRVEVVSPKPRAGAPRG